MTFDVCVSGHSSFVIAGLYKDTCVEAWQKRGGKLVRILSVSLGELDVYHVMSKQGEDFTGVIVNATRPLAVYGGHECANVPVNAKFCDHLVRLLTHTYI